ncbi:MAG TPA: tryptophan--tRNA ligase [Terriglobia bacterium]|nr:tryptophan--tRNA ligase [Terriglobia bacterium]
MSEQKPERKTKPRILSGMRPTGRLHLGNLVGALQNWIALQDTYESYHCVVDWHMLTTEYANTGELQDNIWQMTADWLAAGLDPVKAAFFIQSQIIEHAELHLLLSMLTPLGWLERVPTYKEQLENIKDRDIHTYGFLGYPVLQAADILIYKANAVPVGEDQAPHIELAREIARRFNLAYGKAHGSTLTMVDGRTYEGAPLEVKAEFVNRGLVTVEPLFPEPQTLLTPTPRLPGTDGRKMSKSYGNAIYLSDTPAEVSKKVAGMMTDPARKRRNDPGDPDVCPVFDHHKVFSPQPVIDRVNAECRTAAIGCVDCKKLLAAALNERLAPIQERRRVYEQHPGQVWDVLDEGTARARKVAQATMSEVRQAMGLARPVREGLASLPHST